MGADIDVCLTEVSTDELEDEDDSELKESVRFLESPSSKEDKLLEDGEQACFAGA